MLSVVEALQEDNSSVLVGWLHPSREMCMLCKTLTMANDKASPIGHFFFITHLIRWAMICDLYVPVIDFKQVYIVGGRLLLCEVRFSKPEIGQST
jgi:hypothetical protein